MSPRIPERKEDSKASGTSQSTQKKDEKKYVIPFLVLFMLFLSSHDSKGMKKWREERERERN
jgi:hypothetical protein